MGEKYDFPETTVFGRYGVKISKKANLLMILAFRGAIAATFSTLFTTEPTKSGFRLAEVIIIEL